MNNYDPKSKNDSSKRLILQAFGDCNTEGSEQLPVGECVPTKLQDLLETNGYQIQLENHGGTMNCSREGVSRITDNSTSADIVLINYGLVDSWHTSLPQLYVPYYPNGRLRKFARKILKLTKRRLRSPLIRKFLTVGPVVELEEFRNNISNIIHEVLRRNPAAQILIWSTVPVRGDSGRNALIADYNSCLETLANQYGCRYLDIQPLVGNRNDLYLDKVHLNGNGANFVAKQMQKVICERLHNTNASRAA